MLTLTAPAKINLTLEVLGKRPDGYHEIRSIMQAVSLTDSLHFELSAGTRMTSNRADWNPELSLVSKAVNLVRQSTGYNGGVTIDVEKRIPLMSGLGGDSSDAAATIAGLDEVWELRLSEERLRELAAQLGSDVPFFLCDGTAVVSGRGDTVMQLPPLARSWFVILVPPVPTAPGKTARMYVTLDPSHYTTGQVTVNLVSSIALGARVSLSRLVNVFDKIAFDMYSDLEDYFAHFSAAGAREVHLAGSGPALFTALENGEEARTVYTKLQQMGLECYLAESVNKGGGI